MRITACTLQNFASYKELSFDFSNQGLTLIQGPTGSGKSTLMDAVPWTLFGVTAKGGSVSEVLSWPGIYVTSGNITLDSGDTVVRSRGPKASDNDLFIIDKNGDARRGKDMPDTQRLINSMLNMDAYLYLAGAYYHEFSQTAQFFTTTAKNRRLICEQLVDLSLATKLKDKLTEKCKLVKINLDAVLQSIRDEEYRLVLKKNAQTAELERSKNWGSSRAKTKEYILSNYDKFESRRKRIISNECSECGTVLACPKEVIDTSENPYVDILIKWEAETNPFKAELKDNSEGIKLSESRLFKYKLEQTQWRQELTDLEQLQEVVQDYRSVSIKNAIDYIETQTNRLLTDHFDAEIKVVFSVESADKLEVSILKDSNEASYTQLSKGQRCLLKLCFGVSVMQAVQNHHGLSFGEVFFDESLDGMDEVMKSKAYRMFETISLNYGSVFVVEHSEGLKALFNNAYTVSLVNGSSQIEKA